MSVCVCVYSCELNILYSLSSYSGRVSYIYLTPHPIKNNNVCFFTFMIDTF